jgi:hypothetical protein
MNGESATETGPSAPNQPPRRRSSSAWVAAGFLVLLGALIVVNQVTSTSGPPIKWIDNDLDGALRRLTSPKQRLFLYLYDPNDPTYERNEREVFAQRWAREPLANVVCCRVALRSDAASAKLGQEFAYNGKPLFLVITKNRTPMSRTEGAVTELEFYTYITLPVTRAPTSE